MNYTTTSIIASLKTRGLVPTAQGTFTDQQFVTLLNEELQGTIVSQILATRGDYFVKEVDVNLTSSLLYDIPSGAIGGKIANLKYFPDGDTNGPSELVPYLPLEQQTTGFEALYNRFYFSLKSNKISLYYSNSVPSGMIRIAYYKRPNDLVVESAAGRIVGFDLNLLTVDLSNVPATFVPGTAMDIIAGKPQFDSKAVEVTIVSIAGTTVTLSAVPSDIAIGDYLALTGESPIPQVPVEFHPILAQRGAVKTLEALGDRNGMKAAQEKLQELESKAMALITPRIDGNPKKIQNFNNPLRPGGIRRNWF